MPLSTITKLIRILQLWSEKVLLQYFKNLSAEGQDEIDVLNFTNSWIR
jgi:hypothetical protein